MKRIILAVAALLAWWSAALAQNVTVIGPITPGDCAMFNSTTVIKDGGIPCPGSGGTFVLPNGTTATTQALNDNTTKVATDAFVQNQLAAGTGTLVVGTTPISGGTPNCLLFDLSNVLACSTTLPSGLNVRLKIPSSTYFVDDINGNDSNACTAATAGACKTLNGVVARIGSFDLNYQAVTVSVAAPASSYAGMSCINPWVGFGSVTFTGNTTTPTNVLVAGGASPAFDIENGCVVELRGFSVSSTTGPASVQALLNSRIFMKRMDLANAPTSGPAVYSTRESYVEISDTLGATTIHTGTTAFYLFQASHSGELRIVCTSACLSYTANSTYGQYTFLSDHGDIVGTPSASFALNGFTVTSNQWFAGSTGSIQWNGNMPPNDADIPGTAGSGVVCVGSGFVSLGPQSCNFGGNGAATTFAETIGGTAGTIWRNQANNAELARLTNTGSYGLDDSNPQGVLVANGNVTIGTTGALPAASNTVTRTVGKDTQVAAHEINAFGNESLVVGSRADGTAASKTAIAAANEPIYANFAYGWTGSVYAASAGFIMWSSETWTATHTGSYMSLYTSPTGTFGAVEAARIQPSGGIEIGPTVANDPGAGGLSVSASYRLGAKLMTSATPPTVNAGFCTTPSISNNNGTSAFTVTIGSACAASTGVLNLPTASVGWACNFRNVTNNATSAPSQTASTVSTVSVTNYVRTTGVAGNWTAADVIVADCTAY